MSKAKSDRKGEVKIISLSKEVYADIAKHPPGFNFSAWVEKKYREDFMQIETLAQEQKELKMRLDWIGNKIIELQQKHPEQCLNQEQERWLETQGVHMARMGKRPAEIAKEYNILFPNTKLEPGQMKATLEKKGQWFE